MTPRYDHQFGNVTEESTNVTRGIEQHKYINNKRTAEILNSMGFGYLAGAFDSKYQNSK